MKVCVLSDLPVFRGARPAEMWASVQHVESHHTVRASLESGRPTFSPFISVWDPYLWYWTTGTHTDNTSAEDFSKCLQLWQVNFSVEKVWITDITVKQILRKYRPFVTNLNLRGCTSLTWHSLTCISEYSVQRMHRCSVLSLFSSVFSKQMLNLSSNYLIVKK